GSVWWRHLQDALKRPPGPAAALACAWLLRGQRAAAGLGPPRRPRGAGRRWGNLDCRDQVLGGGLTRRSEMDGLPDALRPAVLRHHGRGTLRDISAGHRVDRRRRLWRADRLRGAGPPAARIDPQKYDAEHCPRRRVAAAVADRPDRAVCGRTLSRA